MTDEIFQGLISRIWYESDRIPVFVTLKEFSEALGKPDLQSYVAQQWEACKVEGTSLPQVLDAGRVLVLLDGLDEVQDEEHDRVLHSIKGFTEQFHNCQCVMTCRIAAREYTFEQFTEVEVADFKQEQIEDFATKWFGARQDPDKGESFIKRLQDNKPIQELATNPLLLTLLCWVFGEANDFPLNRSELYKEGLDVLLKKWDGKRNIERDQVYKKLSLKRKEDLLSQLAYQTFEKGDYFFKQNVIEKKIIDYICNLSGANEDEEALQLDSEAVLKSIEAQHGLLVERARGIYSFSHLTFQEYFTAKQITCPTSQLPKALENLAKHCLEKRYREVFFLVVGMLPEADDFFRLLKIQVDQLMADEPELQKFLAWVSGKAQSVKVDHQLEAIRAYYLDLSLDLFRSRSLDLDLSLSLFHSLSRSLDLSLSRSLDLPLFRPLSLDLNLSLFRSLNQLAKSESKEKDDPEIIIKLKALQSQLPDPQDIQAVSTWWTEMGESWIKNLRQVMIDHRNIGHDWQFTPAQTEKLQQYFEANQLVVDCLNSDCYVTKAMRQEILSTLLLPMSELEELPNLAN
ncbi:NACHT domain-containing NTPase [Acaryochloris marina]|uniref:NACHT domain-containing protein n=1 Tax=Acaryochloris marina TaxID=155978 RepID=UPI002016C741|nr:NACHT domain-containing protein [Acaryochloris marina]